MRGSLLKKTTKVDAEFNVEARRVVVVVYKILRNW